jgi:hypothetical protein
MDEAALTVEQSKSAEPQSSSVGSWWNSVVSSIKATAEKVVEVYKEDLREFAGNITLDTEQVIDDVKHSEFVEKAIAAASSYDNTLLSQVVDAISDDNNATSNSNAGATASRLEAKILELQKDIGTYCTSPAEEQFVEFCKSYIGAEKEQVLVILFHLFVCLFVCFCLVSNKSCKKRKFLLFLLRALF